MPSESILYIVPDLIGLPNGIGRYCQLVCQALVEGGAEFSVVALRDKPSAAATAEETLGFRLPAYLGCESSRPCFIAESFRALGRRRPGVVLVGHPNFAPLGWALARAAGAR